ncbi:hypothetical protein ACIBAI_14640 [Streptomyces sp. NPDC051041]|uniref:hypothetical protein n=1 Tax=Streptomyces sp. NPDC051041 TaxID=3365640 RepID=UPI00378A6F08
MRERPDVVDGTSGPREAERKRIDLSVPQVAGSALAAVVAAGLASCFGVYGTILGAGVVSAIATCGGTLFQHLLGRTGEQFRDAAAAPGRPGTQAPPAPGEFTEGTVHRARTGGRKRPVLAVLLVFGVTMTAITAYELASGRSLDGGRSTTVGGVLSGPGASPSRSGEPGGSDGSGDPAGSASPADPDADDEAPTATPSGTPSGTGGTAPPDGASPGGGTASSPAPSPTGSRDAGGDSGGGTASSPAPSAPATAPEPSADSRSGTAGPGRDGPAAP